MAEASYFISIVQYLELQKLRLHGKVQACGFPLYIKFRGLPTKDNNCMYSQINSTILDNLHADNSFRILYYLIHILA